MKLDFVLLKRSKIDNNRFAFVYDNDLMVSFTAAHLFRALHSIKHSDTIKDVDVLWRDGTRTAEQLRIIERRHFVRLDTAEIDYYICLPLRAQGLTLELATPVDVRSMFDMHGSLIEEIRVPCEVVADLKAMLTRLSNIDESDEDEDEELDDEDEGDMSEGIGYSPEDRRQLLVDFSYRAADWSSALTDEQVDTVHDLEFGIDEDIDRPKANDAQEEYF